MSLTVVNIFIMNMLYFKITSKNERNTSDSEFIKPYPKNLQIGNLKCENPFPMEHEQFYKDPNTLPNDDFQCNTIIHRPNSPCMALNIGRPNTPLPISDSSKNTSSQSYPIQGRSVQK